MSLPGSVDPHLDTAAARIAGPAIVTGAGQGLGRAFAIGLARRGAPVVVADITDKADAVAAEICDAGGRAISVRVDVTDQSAVEALAERACVAFGTPAVLVNNAAVFSTLRLQPYTDIPVEEWRTVLDVNVTGAFLCCRSIAPLMAKAGYGKIINISSAAIWLGRPGYLHYVTSKAALLGLTRALANEVGKSGVRVNAVTPGSTRTEIERATITAAEQEALASNGALGRVQYAADVVGTVLFLASTDSDFVTGQTINVDGGVSFP
jgi:3-oxoacyl-[acyl-carrier protein] reductase